MVEQKRLVICADDFAHSPQTSAAIIELIEGGSLNATSCMVEASTWADSGKVLRQCAAERPNVALGLHLNLTERIGSRAKILSPARLALDGSRALTDAIYEDFRRQWTLFEEVIGKPPHFLDGHQHAHLAPAPRTALFRLIESTGFAGWVRQCRTSSNRPSAKRLVLDGMSDQLKAEAQRRAVALNPGFGGLRRFRPDEDIVAVWVQDITAMRQGGVLMVHAGGEAPGDEIGACRKQEAEALPRMAEMLAEQGFSLQVEALHPW